MPDSSSPSSEDSPGPKRSLPLRADAYSANAYSVDVTLLSDEEIAALNRDYRHKNKATDVLSFSLWEGARDDDIFPNFRPASEELPLGDLVISLETATRQAADLNHSLPQEIEFLAVHGILHLLGYDHIRAADRRLMWKMQEEIVSQL